MIIKNLRRISLVAAAAVGLSAVAPSSQAQVSVDVNVTLDGIVILDYYNQINITIPSAALLNLTGCTLAGSVQQCSQGTISATATVAGSQLVVPTTPVPLTPVTGTIDLAAVPLLLEDVWAVRAIATAAQQVNVLVAVPGGASTLTNGAATIELSLGSGTNPVVFPPPGLAAPVHGNVSLELDLSNATLAGQYSSASGSDYTLTATLN